MTFWNLSNLAAVTGGRWLSAPPAGVVTSGVSIDSRAIRAGQAFIAIPGEKFDGHDFVDAAAKAGASVLIVSKSLQPPLPSEGGGWGEGALSTPTLLVPDTIAALQQLAAAYRNELRDAGCRVIAVGGSNGKTTTRNLIHAALSATLRGTQSPKSFNNHLGVPLTLLAASTSDDFVVVEIGTNHPGEIDALGKIARPDAAVIVSIGREHMEFFGTLDGVASEEASLLAHVSPDGLLVLPGDEPARALLEPHVQRLRRGQSVVRFGLSAGCDVRAARVKADAAGVAFRVGDVAVHLPLLGDHNAANATAALAVGRWMGVPDADAAAALERVQPVSMRLQARTVGPITLINDAYNANPESMARAIQTLASFPVQAGGRRVAVLGDMLELGATAPDSHRELGQSLGASSVDLAVLVGRLSMFAAQELAKRWPPERVHAFAAWTDDLPAQVADLLQPGDAVLIKASRSIGLERLVPAIEARFGKLGA